MLIWIVIFSLHRIHVTPQTYGRKKNWCRGARLHGSPSYMQNLHPPISCSCTATALKGSQPHVFCCAVPPSQHYILYHQESKLRQWDRLSPAPHSHSPQSGAEQNRVWKSRLKTQIRNPKTSSYKPNLQNRREFYIHATCTSKTWARRGVCVLWALGQWQPAWRMP